MTTHTLTVTTREYALIAAALTGLEVTYRRGGVEHDGDADDVRALNRNLAKQIIKKTK